MDQAKIFTRNLQRGFGFSLLILLISSAASFFSIQLLSDKAEWVSHTGRVLQQSELIASMLKDAESSQRGFLLTGIDSFLNPYRVATQKIYNSVDKLTEMTIDNPEQQENCRQLSNLVTTRMARLAEMIRVQRTGKLADTAALIEGHSLMNRTRSLISIIQSQEQILMKDRTQSFDTMAWLTPFIIIISALSAFIITFFFYAKVRKDYESRVVLQLALERSDKETSDRIRVIEDVASQISSGNYKVRVDDAEKGSMGALSVSLNAMAVTLDDSFEDLKKREWLKTGTSELNDLMIGEKDVTALSKKIVEKITAYSQSAAGAIYISDSNTLKRTADVALSNDSRKSFSMGEGLVGQCADDRLAKVLNNLPQDDIIVTYTSGSIKPNNLALFPLIWEDDLKGVIEMVSLTPYGEKETEWFSAISSSVGLSIESAKQNTWLQQLLNETQAQAEELQTQQNELELLNADLETQAHKLQVSEEELKVQQEELLQANQELEERSIMLEEKNQEIVERNIEIQRKSDELESTTRYKSEFLANMSHELRTPLNSILLLSRLLSENQETNLTSEQVEFANVIQTSGNGLLTLIDEILDLSKIEAGKMKVEFREINLREVVNNMNALFMPMTKDKNLTFSVDASDAPETMITDSLRLEQILRNLLSNAIKFTTKGSIALKISGASGKIRFAVTDTGIGIPADKQHLVFEAFQQADGSTRRKYGGTGLGLSISRELAKLLGGEIQLQSEPGKGSQFTLQLPVNYSIEQVAEEKDTFVPTQVPASESKPDVIFAPESIADDRDQVQKGDKVILIVEDDTYFAQTLISYARKNGYKALVAQRGDYGLHLAMQYHPTAILLDIKLPVKSGWQVMDELKANAATRHIPVHMMSSMQAKEESLSRGAIDFINKPVLFEQLPDVFLRIDEALHRGPRKILIVEENEKHAQALSYFLETSNVNVRSTQDIHEASRILIDGSADCVVLEMKMFTDEAYDELENIKRTAGLEHLPIVIFTGKSLSKTEETRIRQVADSIVIKTANSYKRILDEIDVFLQIVEENDSTFTRKNTRRLSALEQVLENKTVLLVDDDIRNIFSLTKALESQKMNVITAMDGKDGIEQLKQNPKINIVLMDMMMPEMDGYEATQAIRAMPQYRNLPVLAITAKAMYGDREKCIQAGASDYISKPIDVDQLISLLRVWLYQ